ncbi:MAG TPA: hypothetical protein PK771_11740 [Spirochaetota bacterium]|nr:hypothetical protein [Spirochaetota bacterium]
MKRNNHFNLNKNDNETALNEPVSIMPTQKKYMYKPMGKNIYQQILFVKDIFEANKSNGWVDELPNGAVSK